MPIFKLNSFKSLTALNSFDSQSNSSAESDSTDERRGILDGDGGIVGILLGVVGILEGEVGSLEIGILLPEPADFVEWSLLYPPSTSWMSLVGLILDLMSGILDLLVL